MQIKVEEISDLIRQKIEGFKLDFNKDETGVVISIGDGIAQIYGLENVMYNELIEFPEEIFGIALNLEEDNVGAIILGEGYKIKEGEENNQKLQVILKQGKNNTVSIGNGCNDVSMLKESAIGICIVGAEGASVEAMMASDLAVSTINDALDLLLKPHRLKATLRR